MDQSYGRRNSMRYGNRWSLLALIVLVMALTACSATAEHPRSDSEASTEVAESESESEEALSDYEEFDYGNFDNPTVIDNKWFPLQPGTHYVYEGTTNEDGEMIPHRIEYTVTDLTKEIDGVSTVVVWIGDYADDELVEAELAFYAQDNDGTVWFLGEYPEEYEDGELVDAPSWIAGLEDAKAGISMHAEPQPDTPSYAQGWGPAVEWTDRGQVHEVGAETCVPVDCYQDVLVIRETSLEEPDAWQLKYYAPGVGGVQVGWLGEEDLQEELVLTELVQLDADALAEVRAVALELEESAYENSEELYGQTSPAK